MSKTVIRTTIDDLPHAPAQYSRTTQVEVYVLDTTKTEADAPCGR